MSPSTGRSTSLDHLKSEMSALQENESVDVLATIAGRCYCGVRGKGERGENRIHIPGYRTKLSVDGMPRGGPTEHRATLQGYGGANLVALLCVYLNTIMELHVNDALVPVPVPRLACTRCSALALLAWSKEVLQGELSRQAL